MFSPIFSSAFMILVKFPQNVTLEHYSVHTQVWLGKDNLGKVMEA